MLTDFFKNEAPKLAKQIAAQISHTHKAQLSQDDLDRLDEVLAALSLTGFSVIIGEVRDILENVAADGQAEALIQIGIGTEARKEILNIVRPEALEYAETRSAEMVGMKLTASGKLIPNPNAKWQISESTRDYVKQYVKSAMQEGWSNEQLATALKSSYAFSDDRAMMIARTETNKASNAGALSAYKASNVVEGKKWSTADDDLVSEECAANEDAGVIRLDEDFPSGDDSPPLHPNCRCVLIPYVTFNEET